MDTIISYTISGVVDLGKLAVNSAIFLVNGSYDQDLAILVAKVDGMDLHTKINLAENFLKAIDRDNILLLGLDTTIKTLGENLVKIQQEINNHKNKWFRRYRKVDVPILMMNLERDNTIITERLRYLMIN